MTGYDLLQIAVGGAAGGLSFSAGFVVVRWTANFIAGRLDKKEDRIDAGMAKLIDGLKERVDLLSKSEKELRTELAANRVEFRAYQKDTDEQLRECRRKHAESEAEVMQLRSMMQGRGDARNDSARIVATDRVADRRKDG